MDHPKTSKAISKILSANDTGETGSHQAGILVPKKPEILSFFPTLDYSQKNPRHHLFFYDESDARWEFAYIYYNNRFLGGTRDEYRLTRMTPFLRQNGLSAGDELILEQNDEGIRRVRYKRQGADQNVAEEVLRLGTAWRVLKTKKGRK